ncbi:MAG: hypothetical protein POELPBGB_01409 [Bacteroidia bacterium]|nr:hypothetical protein [Bacteroidia bacterium]
MTIKYFIYARKSTESEDKQMASIEDQIAEMLQLAKDSKLEIVDTISEAKSAKEPGRIGFNTMLKRIHKGEAQGILCWKLNRLARNPVDGGQISWLLQQNTIKHIQTYGRDYKPSDNVLMMQVEFGMANQYIKDLSVDVKRGLRRKAERGWYGSQHMPIGYKHNTGYRLGIDDEIVPTSKTFNLVKSLWRKMLTGNYSVASIRREGNKMGLHNSAGNTLSHNTYHRLFTNEFYCGFFYTKDENGELLKHEGKHKKMVSVQEFEKVQRILRGYGNPTRQTTYIYPYRGLISCGGCGGFVTAERKLQAICTNCKYKFSIITNTICPSCKTDLRDMPAKPTIIDKVYYRCTKNHGDCTEGCVSDIHIENEIKKGLAAISINQEFYEYVLQELAHFDEVNNSHSIQLTQLEKRKTELENRLEGLVKMRADNEITGEEFRALRQKSETEIVSIQQELKFQKDCSLNWKKAAQEHFRFAVLAVDKFLKAEEIKKKNIASEFASNLKIKDKKLEYTTRKCYQIIKECEVVYQAKKKCFEPETDHMLYSQKSCYWVSISILREKLQQLRTCLIDKLQSEKNISE